MTKSVVFIKDQNNHYRVVIEVVPDWDGFDKLISYLEVNYETKILESYDGPDARRWIIQVNGKKIEFIHNDGFGNYFLAPTIESEEIVRMIGKDLEKQLNQLDGLC